MKTSLLPKGGSSNIHECKSQLPNLLSVLQDIKWQELHCTKQLCKNATGPYMLKDFFQPTLLYQVLSQRTEPKG